MQNLDQTAEDFTLPPAPRGRRAVPVTCELIRELGPEDVETLVNQQVFGPPPRQIKQLRNSHHNLAMLLAKGHDHGTVSLMTGYSEPTISLLMADPSFIGLYEHYISVREMVFVDVLERMKAVGLNSLEELQARLDEGPEKFSNREIMEMTELLLVKPTQGARGAGAAGASGPGTNINISFVTPVTQQPNVPVIEGTLIDE